MSVPPVGAAQRRALADAVSGLPALAGWLAPALDAVQEPGSLAFRASYAAAARKLGPAGKVPASASLPNQPLLRAHWSLLDVGRWLLVHRRCERLGQGEHAAFVDELFRGGELGEQVSLLRTLALLPEPERLVEVAVEACRSNAVAVFEAIACDNAFPAAYFTQLAWNQMVMKAIFIELGVRRIDGLEARVTPELVRMAEGLRSEREKAGRQVPEDIATIVAASRHP